MQNDHYRKLEHMYLSAPCNDYFRPTIDVTEGQATIVIPVRPDLFHAAGAVHGSVYFKAMDDATFFAVQSLVKDAFVLTSSFTVYFTRPILNGALHATGTVVSQSKRVHIAEAVVTDSKGREIGRGSGTFMSSRKPLGPEIGYR